MYHQGNDKKVVFFLLLGFIFDCFCYYSSLGINDQGLYRVGGVSSKVQKLLSLMIGEYITIVCRWDYFKGF